MPTAARTPLARTAALWGPAPPLFAICLSLEHQDSSGRAHSRPCHPVLAITAWLNLSPGVAAAQSDAELEGLKTKLGPRSSLCQATEVPRGCGWVQRGEWQWSLALAQGSVARAATLWWAALGLTQLWHRARWSARGGGPGAVFFWLAAGQAAELGLICRGTVLSQHGCIV